MQRHFISKKEIRKLKQLIKNARESLTSYFNITKGNVELAIVDNIQIYIIDGVPSFIVKEEIVYPTLVVLYKKPELIKMFKTVTVDQGAVPHILNGADVMVPGIVNYSNDIKEDDLVIVLDEKGRPLAIGLALMPSSAIESAHKGKAIKNLHYVRDKLWNLCISLISS